jgi:hypothetical protein
LPSEKQLRVAKSGGEKDLRMGDFLELFSRFGIVALLICSMESGLAESSQNHSTKEGVIVVS